MYDPEIKQRSNVWVFKDDPNLSAEGARLSHFLVSSGITGHVSAEALEQRKVADSEWYATICLPEVIKEIRKR